MKEEKRMDEDLKVLVKDGLTGDMYQVEMDGVSEEMIERFIWPIEKAIKDKPKEYIKAYLEGFKKGLIEKAEEEFRGYLIDKTILFRHFFSNRTEDTEHAGYLIVK